MEEAFNGVFSPKSRLLFLSRQCLVLFCFALTRGFCKNVSVFPFEFKDSTQGNKNERERVTFSYCEFSCFSPPILRHATHDLVPGLPVGRTEESE